MRVEIPTCTRCFCLPLRYGIIISGYVHLISSLMVVLLETSTGFEIASPRHAMVVYRGVMFFCQIWLIVILYSFEIIFSIILIVGAHMKKTSMLQAFYYYSMTTTLAVLVIFLMVRYDDDIKNINNHIIESTLAFCGFVFQIYLLLLIRSELKKVKDRSQLTFVNHISEIIVDGPMSEGRNPL
ncbi:uncharacterized protein [Epargyreus clarus]|uniref:uncharacterized protein n=1 Tax=Epargyreus clarus TaxID=520877 RepID=UPI003C2FA562